MTAEEKMSLRYSEYEQRATRQSPGGKGPPRSGPHAALPHRFAIGGDAADAVLPPAAGRLPCGPALPPRGGVQGLVDCQMRELSFGIGNMLARDT